MKKGAIIGIVIGVIVLLCVVLVGSSYNSLVTAQEDVESELANIDVQLERRADLIPNLVNSVKGYMSHEEKIIDEITKARENLVNSNSIQDKANANEQLTDAINNLFVIVENYPDLKANTNFINLQDELAGTENRISTARKDYNDSVKTYNKMIKSFPKNIIANIFGFEQQEYFEASDKASEVPEVSFD